ncbi:hypothetical protein ACQP2F_09025 [Actinoplanes sp. CA-030573]|uniref:hypothetical protein n=1 Tax=Actinoplanes sp. CA-030573 TaxID=3239898 RepID=UPI003D91C17D
MRRFLLFLAGMASVIAVLEAPATASAAASPTSAITATGATAADGCASAASATYRHTFNGTAGTVTIAAVKTLCSGQKQAFSLVSYTSGAPGSNAGQFLYDTATGTITASRRSVTLKVAVPACYAQVDAFAGTAVRTETTSMANPYGSATLGASGSRSAGPLASRTAGATACTAVPTVTYANACDGTFTATLANAATANAEAVFLSGSRRIRLSPGRSTTIKVARGATFTVRDSSFTTHVAQWRAPSTPCVTTPVGGAAPAGQAGTGQPAARTPSGAPSPSAASPTATNGSATAGPTYAEAPAAYPTFPDDTDAAATAIADTGMGTGSIIAIALGLLMIGAGATALTWLVRLNRRLA